MLGVDHLNKMGIVLDIRNQEWNFHNNPTCKFPFAESPFQIEPDNAATVLEANPAVMLREHESQHLSSDQKVIFKHLLGKFSNIVQPGGKPTSLVVHHIKTRAHLPISVPPCKISPGKDGVTEISN